jgi:hypothetical protein
MAQTASFARATLVAALLAVSFDASAAPGSPRDAPSADTQAYRSLINDAVAEYDAKHFAEARALFRRAHELEPSARTWRGIGMAAFELRDYVKSLRALEASLVDSRLPLNNSERDQVQALADQARVFVGRFVIRLSPKDAVLKVDQTPTELDDGDILLLEFGHHVLTALAPDRRSEKREINVVGGERREISINLPPLPRPDVDLTGHAPGAAESSGPAWWFGGAGVLAAGAIGGVLWWRYQSSQLDGCDDALAHGSVCRNRSGLVLRNELALATAIGSAAGGFALGTIATLKWTERDKKTGNPVARVAVACVPAPARVGCEIGVLF